MENKELRVYHAGSLFTEKEREARTREFNLLKEKLGDVVDIYSPMFNDEINDKSKEVTPESIFLQDTEQVLKADYLMTSVEEIISDPGVSMEVGIALGVNLVLSALCEIVEQGGITNVDDVLNILFDGIPGKKIFANVTDIRLLHDNPQIGLYKDCGINQYCLGGLLQQGHSISHSFAESVEELTNAVDVDLAIMKLYDDLENEEEE